VQVRIRVPNDVSVTQISDSQAHQAIEIMRAYFDEGMPVYGAYFRHLTHFLWLFRLLRRQCGRHRARSGWQVGFERHGSGVRKGGCLNRSLRTFARKPTRLRRAVDSVIPCRVASQQARLRLTGQLNRKRLSLQRQHLRTPEPCLENPTAGLGQPHYLRKSRMNPFYQGWEWRTRIELPHTST
jgi:hypothetical protein